MSASDEVSRRILVIDDEPMICALIQAILSREGFEVEIAPNGRMAQEMIEADGYHLCLIDMLMPKMTGREFYEWLLRRYPRIAGRAIFTTGSVVDEEIMAFISVSGRPFLPKPFTPADLRARVQEALGQGEG